MSSRNYCNPYENSPGLSKTRLSRKLGNLSNGVQGTIPAIRKIQQQLDMDLAHRNIDLDNIKVIARITQARRFFPAPGLCSLFARAKMLYRRLVDDVVEISVLLHTSYFW